MLNPDKIVFTTACLFPSTNNIHLLRDSCIRLGVPLEPYGLGVPFIDWTQAKVTEFVKAAKGWLVEGKTHVFYTDGRDSFMLSGVEEILAKYAKMGEPPYLISAEDNPFPNPAFGPSFPDPGHPWRYLGAGQYMGELGYMVDLWDKLTRLYTSILEDSHDQGWLQRAWAWGDLDQSTFILDTGCAIFQTAAVSRAGGEVPNYVELGRLHLKPPRIYNPITDSWPCALHLPGGYSDPVTGKDSTLTPIVEALWR